jgi:hypothetical protein
MQRIFHSAAGQYAFFSETNGTLSKIDHILAHKANLNKHKNVEITPCTLPDND